jgi:hypothetical protein
MEPFCRLPGSNPCTDTMAHEVEDRSCRHCGGSPDGTEAFCAIGEHSAWLHRRCIDAWAPE